MSNTNKFGDAFLTGIQASEHKAKNLSDIEDVIKNLSEAIKDITTNKISISYKSSRKNSIGSTLAAITMASAIGLELNETPKNEKPENKAIYAINSQGNEELLTPVELGNEGFPCTIYIDGNKLIAMDKQSLEENISQMLSSATIGDKFQRLLNKLEFK